MGEIYDKGIVVYSDHSTPGVAASELKEPSKAEIRDWIKTVDLAVYASQAGIPIVANIAARDAFFGDEANRGKMVYVNNNNGAADDPVNGVYEYVGGPRLAVGFYQGVLAGVQGKVDEAEAAAAAANAAASTLRTNLYPDTFFRASAANTIHAVSGHFIYSRLFNNRYWEADYSHEYGVGAWRYNPGLAQQFQGFPIWFDFNSPGQPALVEGGKVSVGANVKASGGTVSFSGRFFGAGGPQDFIGAQINGSVAVAQDGTLKVLKIEDKTLPAGAVGFHVYLYDATASEFYTTAIWALPGAVAGNAPPPNVARAESTSQSDRGDGRAAFAVEKVPTWSGVATVIPATGQSQTVRTNNFTGYGNVFTPAGGAWNAIRVPELRQTAAPVKWEELHLVVRIGASGAADDAGAALVAHGKVQVDPNATILLNTVFPLRDPLTGKLIANVEPLLTGAEYGVFIYARTAKGVNASMNQPNGTLANRVAARSYYATVIDAANFGWSVLGPDSGIALEHVLLANLADGFAPSVPLRKALEKPADDELPTLIVPPKLFALPGQQFNLYNEAVLVEDPASYYVEFDSNFGNPLEECFRWNAPVAGERALTAALYDKRKAGLLVTKNTTIVTSAADAGDGDTLNVMIIGDSRDAPGAMAQKMYDRGQTDGMEIMLWGTQGTGDAKHEAYSGYQIDDFTTAGRVFKKLTVADVDVLPVISGSKYQDDATAAIITVQQLNLAGGDGTITFSVDSGVLPAGVGAGTLTKLQGEGDDTIAFTAVEDVAGNKWWIGGANNFGQFLDDYSIPPQDAVLFAPLVNGVIGQDGGVGCKAYVDSKLSNLDLLITSVLASSPTTIFGIELPPSGNSLQSAFGVDYNGGISAWRARRNFAIARERVIARYSNTERVAIVASGMAVDVARGYAFSNPVAHSHTAETVRRGAAASAVHAAAPLEDQMVDYRFAWLKSLAAE